MKIHPIQTHINHPILITDEKMIAYLVNQRFYVAERFIGLLIKKDEIILYLNNLFPTQLKGLQIRRFDDTEDPIKLLNHDLKSDILYVDKHMKAGFLLRLMKQNTLLRIEIEEITDKVRSIKDNDEISKMRKASLINDQAMEIVQSHIKEGITEIELASLIPEIYQTLGAQDVSFTPIVAFGVNTSDPHATPNETKLSKGMPIIVDMGCVYEGYCSDMTRSFFYQENTLNDIYNIVKEANLAAIKVIKPGVMLKDVDEAARSVIRKAGYGEFFIHRTGHGIGQEVHEPYDVSATSETLCEIGMIFSVEPGIYLPNIGGIRIEDLVLVTENGCEVLNHYSKDLKIIK
jgi:Xaa-Pro dipeptidase